MGLRYAPLDPVFESLVSRWKRDLLRDKTVQEHRASCRVERRNHATSIISGIMSNVNINAVTGRFLCLLEG